jgi:O-antigen ligase
MKSLSKVLGVYFGLIVFPYFVLFGINISAFIFLVFVYIAAKKKILYSYNSPVKIFLILIIVGLFFSSVFNFEVDSVFKNINYLYWVLLVHIIIKSRYYMNLVGLLKYILPFFVILIFYSYTRELIPKNSFITQYLSSNTVAFLFVCFTTPVFIYLKAYKQNVKLAYFVLVLVLFSLLLSGRRAGFVLVLTSAFFTLNFNGLNILSVFKFCLASFLLILTLNLNFVSSSIESKSPRIHSLIYSSEKIIDDRSYQTRLAMIEKGLIIFGENKIFGVGIGNFTNTNVNFSNTFSNTEIVTNKSSINDTSAHNSYIQLLAELGLIVFLPFICLLLFNILTFTFYLKSLNNMQKSFYSSFFACLIHLYFISALFNVYSWALIAIVTSQSVLIRENNKK